MDFPITIDSQEKFDDLVKDRLTREKSKLDEALQKVQAAESAKTEAEKQRDAAAAERDTFKGQVDDLSGKVQAFESEKQISKWRDEVAKAKGVPANALRGTTKEEFEAHADELKPLIKARGPVLPDVDKNPENTVGGDEAERAAVRQLFGSGDE